MQSDTSILRSALQFVCDENTHICRLCFASTEQIEVCVQDLVAVNKPYVEDSLTILEVLNTLSIPDEPCLPQSLCGKCATAVINHYLFVKLCQSYNDKWKNSLDRLEDCLSHTKAISPRAKTAYFVIGETGNTIFTTRQATLGGKPGGFRKLQLLAKECQSEEKRKNVTDKTSYSEKKGSTSASICAVCGEQFRSNHNYKRHVKRHSTNLHCSECDRSFTSRDNLREHQERLHLPKTFLCAQCPSLFGSQRLVKEHAAQYHKPVTCKVCQMVLPAKKDLQTHMYRHKLHQCPICHKMYGSKSFFRKHIVNCGNPRRDPEYFCDHCHKGFLGKIGLRSHLSVQHGFGKTYSCELCEKKYSAVSSLKVHMLKHTRERNFHCDQCGAWLISKPALTNHIRLHTGEKPYTCNYCDETFLSASRRADHTRRKHAEPKFECNICHVKCDSKHKLLKHKERHSNPQSKLYMPMHFMTMEDVKVSE